MADERDEFFDGLKPRLRAAGFATSRGTRTGLNIHFARQRTVIVTANYAPRDNRVSVKITVNRGGKAGPTPLFDALHHQFKPHEDKLIGRVSWDWARPRTESKVEVATNIDAGRNSAHYGWILENAKVLREWANWTNA